MTVATLPQRAITVREAVLSDIPRIVAMGQRFIRETDYHTVIVPSPVALAHTAEHLITSDRCALFVTEAYGVLTGMIGLLLYDHPVSGQLTASELAWWVDPEHRGDGVLLLDLAEAWARAAGATALQMIAPSPVVERFYRLRGFARVEVLYQKGLA